MKLTLRRRLLTDNETIGELLYSSASNSVQRLCLTLEPPMQPNSEHPKGAIPCGWYRMRVTYSPKFQRLLPLVDMVPGFTGIRIHAGNNRHHTAGCILVGEMIVDPFSTAAPPNGEYRLLNSRATETAITELLMQHLSDDEVYLNITTA